MESSVVGLQSALGGFFGLDNSDVVSYAPNRRLLNARNLLEVGINPKRIFEPTWVSSHDCLQKGFFHCQIHVKCKNHSLIGGSNPSSEDIEVMPFVVVLAIDLFDDELAPGICVDQSRVKD